MIDREQSSQVGSCDNKPGNRQCRSEAGVVDTHSRGWGRIEAIPSVAPADRRLGPGEPVMSTPGLLASASRGSARGKPWEAGAGDMASELCSLLPGVPPRGQLWLARPSVQGHCSCHTVTFTDSPEPCHLFPLVPRTQGWHPLHAPSLLSSDLTPAPQSHLHTKSLCKQILPEF